MLAKNRFNPQSAPFTMRPDTTCPPRGAGATSFGGLYGEASPERGAFCKLAVYLTVGKIAILVYERVTKSAAKWKKWWLRRSVSKGGTFWQK